VEVYGVYANKDMTEGRGPIVLQKLFLHREDAWAFANKQPGVMGRSPYRDHKKLRDNGHPQFILECKGWECTLCHPYGGEWEVRMLRVHEYNNPGLSMKKTLENSDIEGFRGIEQVEYGVFNVNPEKFMDPKRPHIAPDPDPREPIRVYNNKIQAISARDSINARRQALLSESGIDRGLVTIRQRVVVIYAWT
jgi:hypothetical protein